MNWKESGRKRTLPNFKALSWHFSGGTEENDETISQDSRFPGRDFNPGLPRYTAGLLITRPLCFLTIIMYLWVSSDSKCEQQSFH
jgi:hypothetical protein